MRRGRPFHSESARGLPSRSGSVTFGNDRKTEAGAEASIHLVPGAAHGFDNSTWPDAEKAMFDWLKARGIGK